MKRRDFLKSAAAGAGAVFLSRLNVGAAPTQPASAASNILAAPCGLYCGLCDPSKCHGCRCDCGKCDGQAHRKVCEIAACVDERKLEDCSACPEFACTKLIQFANDPIWRTHLPVIENLRRRKAIGTAKWLQEQKEYWTDDKRKRWDLLKEECEQKAAQARKKLKT